MCTYEVCKAKLKKKFMSHSMIMAWCCENGCDIFEGWPMCCFWTTTVSSEHFEFGLQLICELCICQVKSIKHWAAEQNHLKVIKAYIRPALILPLVLLCLTSSNSHRRRLKEGSSSKWSWTCTIENETIALVSTLTFNASYRDWSLYDYES